MPTQAREPREAFKGLERAVNGRHSDFTERFVALGRLNDAISSHPDCVNPETVIVLSNLLADPSHTVHKQAFFLYRAAADSLATILAVASNGAARSGAMAALKRVVEHGNGDGGLPQRAASEALGSLPLTVTGPRLDPACPPEAFPAISYARLLKANGSDSAPVPESAGRSLVAPLDNEGRVLVIKLARHQDEIPSLGREASWMAHLGNQEALFSVPFHIPRPIAINGSFLFRVTGLPIRSSEKRRFPVPPWYGMGYIAHRNYFSYPNDHRPGRRMHPEQFVETISRNSQLLGHLTAMGIVHTAPIPLFHNRIQRMRRTDRGRYEWYRGGRLDRWLHSCRYPNFGRSGLRDFEHLKSFRGTSRTLYRHIGDHLLSLLLVTGSYFRLAEPETYGTDACGRPVDVRGLFERTGLTDIIRGIFSRYYLGFTRKPFSDWMKLPFGQLACRMIDEMGVDRHMEEILRSEDQRRMSAEAFRDFLETCGFSDEQIARFPRGVQDIRVCTGPHLGEFNGRISLPELTAFLGSAAGCCIAGKYWHDSG